MSEELLKVLKQEDEARFLSFLQTLRPEEIKQLAPAVKKLDKELHHFELLEGNRYGYKSSEKQRNLIKYACFVCLNRKDFERTAAGAWILVPETLAKVIDWYCPDWFGEYVNNLARAGFVPVVLKYLEVVELAEKGYMIPDKELLARLMPQMIFEQTPARNLWNYKPENVLRKKITLGEHIWYLFQYETDLHYSDRWIQFTGESKEKNKWFDTFRMLVKEDHLDRLRLLKESLLAANRNFNKVLSGWFSDLFQQLEPSPGELKQLQPELFSVLGAPHSKPVNNALKNIKKIAGDKEFRVQDLLDTVPVLLASDTKATVELTLGLLEKLAVKHADFRERICTDCCHVFVHANKDLQQDAAALIAKYGDPKSEELAGALQQASAGMMSNTRSLLKDFLATEAAAATEQPPAEGMLLHAEADKTEGIPFPASIDDLVFLASQAFDNNHTWHVDILPAAILHFAPGLKASDLPRLEPAFQRALDLLTKGFRSTNGYLDYFLACYFVDFGHWLFWKFKDDAKGIEAVFRKYDTKKEDRTMTSFTVAPANSSYVESWNVHRSMQHLQPFRELLQLSATKLNNTHALPLLSTPTHSNGSIATRALIDRMQLYQQKGVSAHAIDLQVAIARCYREPAELQAVHEKLKDEWKALMQFFLDEGTEPAGPFYEEAAWIIASLRRDDKKQWKQFGNFTCLARDFEQYTGALSWKSSEEIYDSQEWDYKIRGYIKVKRTRKQLEVTKAGRVVKKEEGGLLKRLVSGLVSRSPAPATPVFFDTMQVKTDYFDNHHNDIGRLLSLTPHHPSPLMADIINSCLRWPAFWSEGEKKFVLATLHFLYTTWEYKGEMETLFLATCMLSSDKNAVNVAGEIWIRYAPLGKLANERLGQIIGIHGQVEFAPLKRFTDLVSAQLLRISSRHDQLLQQLIENCLLQLPAKPVRNLKKLLEIHEELLSLTAQPAAPAVVEKITAWKK